MASHEFSFQGTGKKILKSLFYCILGALTTWLLTDLPNINLGGFTPFVGMLAPFIVNVLKEYINERK